MANKNCEKETLVEQTTVSACNAPFSICLPFGGNLSMDGSCLKYTAPETIPADGEYSGFIVKGGCIQGVVPPSSPLYTSNTCAPVPNPCDCEGGSSETTPSTLDGNLLTLDALSRPLVQLHYEQGDGISISGKGTTSSPLVISCDLDVPGTIVSGTPAVLSVSTADGVATVSHVETKATTRTINGMTFDNFGHLYSYTEPGTASQYLTANQLIPGTYVSITKDTTANTLTFDIANSGVTEGTYVVGGYSAAIVKNGLITNMTRGITFPAGEYDLGDYRVTFNEYGSAIEIAVIDDSSVVKHSATKRVEAGTSGVTLSFTLANDSGLRVSIKSKAVPNCTVTIDGNVYTGDKIGDLLYEVVTNATFAAGDHTIVVTPASAFTGVAIIDVVLNTVI